MREFRVLDRRAGEKWSRDDWVRKHVGVRIQHRFHEGILSHVLSHTCRRHRNSYILEDHDKRSRLFLSKYRNIYTTLKKAARIGDDEFCIELKKALESQTIQADGAFGSARKTLLQ